MNIRPHWIHHEQPLHVCSECRAVFTASTARLTCSHACRNRRSYRLARKRKVARSCAWQANPSTPVDMAAVKARMPRWLQEVA